MDHLEFLACIGATRLNFPLGCLVHKKVTMKIKEIHYRDVSGKLIWKDKMVFRRPWGVGNDLVYDSKRYIVRGVAVADEVQYVNIELMEEWGGLTTPGSLLSAGRQKNNPDSPSAKLARVRERPVPENR